MKTGNFYRTVNIFMTVMQQILYNLKNAENAEK